MSRKPKSTPQNTPEKKTPGSKPTGSKSSGNTPNGKSPGGRAASSQSTRSSSKLERVSCYQCKTEIEAREQALFVEEEVGRFFCTEGCIVAHFTPEIERLERDYGKHVAVTDLTPEERERYAHLRWLTLEQPSEVWVEKTKAGDHRYTLVAEFRPDSAEANAGNQGASGAADGARVPKKIWGVAVCLMLRQEPSFLYLAFVTSDKNLVDVFRRGAPLQIIRNEDAPAHAGGPDEEDSADESSAGSAQEGTDRLADSWTEADSVRAQIIKNRKESDIPYEDFAFYQNCLEETLQEPTELWSFLPKAAKRVYHFIRRYEHDTPYWYVVIARDTTDETQIEIVDAFPTRDETLVEACRHGKKENMQGAPEAEMEGEVKKTVH